PVGDHPLYTPSRLRASCLNVSAPPVSPALTLDPRRMTLSRLGASRLNSGDSWSVILLPSQGHQPSAFCCSASAFVPQNETTAPMGKAPGAGGGLDGSAEKFRATVALPVATVIVLAAALKTRPSSVTVLKLRSHESE